MGIKELLSKSLAKDPRFKEMQKELHLQKMLEERQKNSNERELERYIEEERQKSIKKNLEEFRKHRQEETWHSGNMFAGQDNMFNKKPTIMNQDKSVLDNGHNILHDKKLFKLGKGKCKQSKKGGMFFK